MNSVSNRHRLVTIAPMRQVYLAKLIIANVHISPEMWRRDRSLMCQLVRPVSKVMSGLWLAQALSSRRHTLALMLSYVLPTAENICVDFCNQPMSALKTTYFALLRQSHKLYLTGTSMKQIYKEAWNQLLSFLSNQVANVLLQWPKIHFSKTSTRKIMWKPH